MTMNFYEAVKNRRSYYNIDKNNVVSDEKIQEIIEHAVKHTPSAFNSQSARIILLLNKHHTRLWDIIKEALREIVPAEKFSSTEEKINSFESGYGTILYFEDNNIVKYLQRKFPTYKENFPLWSHQASGMHQFVIWTALEVEGYGASLQHYNELIEEEVKKEWGIPESWKLIAQMPFGKPTAEPGEKEYEPLEERIKIFK